MKLVPFKIILTLLCIGILPNAQAQLLKNLGKSLEKKAEQAVDKAINKKSTQSKIENNSSKNSNNLTQNNGPFQNLQIANDNLPNSTELVFADNFETETLNAMAKHWTSNGTGTVEKINGFDGKWLKLYHFNTYKIKDLIKIPENFILEFDLLTLAENKNNLNIDFGFDYQKGVSGHNFLAYKNPLNINASYRFDKFSFTSNELGTRKQSEIDAKMSFFTNDTMQIKIVVEGKQMKVYANKYKILDTEMVDPISKKYFYIAVDNEKNQDQVYLSNFKISKF